MLLETVLLLAYQARSGALYERLGVLLTAFMAGLAVGARSARIDSSRRHRTSLAGCVRLLRDWLPRPCSRCRQPPAC